MQGSVISLCLPPSFYRDAVLVVDFLNFVSSADVFILGQRIGVHPGPDDFHGDHAADDLPADAEDICVIVLAGQRGAERILADSVIDAVPILPS